MGWRGVIRAYGASVRAAERDSKRRQRELEKKISNQIKMQELELAAYEVDVYENSLDVLRSIHKDCSEHINWMRISKSKKPNAPIKSSANEFSAKEKLTNYKPGFFDRIFKWEEKRLKKLEAKLEESIKKDEADYKEKEKKYLSELKDWEDSTGFAIRLLAGDPAAKLESIKELNPFAEIVSLGSNVKINIKENGLVEVIISVLGNKVVPQEVKTLLKSGKLSVKQMPKSVFNEIYQDYVCGCVLRVANELFAAIPDDLVVVTAVDELLNSKTGHLEKMPILSACISRQTLKSLNLDTIDPSDSMGNFIHNMSFKKAVGFSPVSAVVVDV